jgi:hypothetical protein
MWAVKPKTRFSLLLLDEGEYYFDDFSAVYYPDLEDEQAVRRKVKVDQFLIRFYFRFIFLHETLLDVLYWYICINCLFAPCLKSRISLLIFCVISSRYFISILFPNIQNHLAHVVIRFLV